MSFRVGASGVHTETTARPEGWVRPATGVLQRAVEWRPALPPVFVGRSCRWSSRGPARARPAVLPGLVPRSCRGASVGPSPRLTAFGVRRRRTRPGSATRIARVGPSWGTVVLAGLVSGGIGSDSPQSSGVLAAPVPPNRCRLFFFPDALRAIRCPSWPIGSGRSARWCGTVDRPVHVDAWTTTDRPVVHRRGSAAGGRGSLPSPHPRATRHLRGPPGVRGDQTGYKTSH